MSIAATWDFAAWRSLWLPSEPICRRVRVQAKIVTAAASFTDHNFTRHGWHRGLH